MVTGLTNHMDGMVWHTSVAVEQGYVSILYDWYIDVHERTILLRRNDTRALQDRRYSEHSIAWHTREANRLRPGLS